MAHHITPDAAESAKPVHPMDTKSTRKFTDAEAKAAKVKKAKKAKNTDEKIGPFLVTDIEALVKKDDKKNPIGFKKWARKYAEGYDNTLQVFRAAYDADMKIARAELKALDRIDLGKFKKAARLIEDPRSGKVRDLETTLAWFVKNEIVSAAPRVSWGNNRLILNISYMPKGLELLKRVFKKQRMQKHLTRISSLNHQPA